MYVCVRYSFFEFTEPIWLKSGIDIDGYKKVLLAWNNPKLPKEKANNFAKGIFVTMFFASINMLSLSVYLKMQIE